MNIKFDLIGNATFVLIIDNKIKIGMDPALEPKDSGLGFGIFRKTEPIYNNDTFENIDFWLLSHPHLDHIDKKGLEKIKKEQLILSSYSNKKILSKNNFKNVKYINWNENYLFQKDSYTIDIIGMPAYHGHNPLVVKLMSKVNGFILKIQNNNESKIVYITSDTIYNSKMEDALKIYNNIDLLIANMGEAKSPIPITSKPITMDLDMLKNFHKITNAKNIIPIHIDDYTHFRSSKDEIAKFYSIINNGETKILDI